MFEGLKIKLRRRFINLLTRHLFNFPTEDDILIQQKDGSLSYKGKALSIQEVNALMDQAKSIKDSFFYKILLEELKYDASKRMLEASNSEDDLYVGKTAFYLIDLIKKVVEKISGVK